MKINPNNLQSFQEARQYDTLKNIADSIDKFTEDVVTLNDSEQDRNKNPEKIVVDIPRSFSVNADLKPVGEHHDPHESVSNEPAGNGDGIAPYDPHASVSNEEDDSNHPKMQVTHIDGGRVLRVDISSNTLQKLSRDIKEDGTIEYYARNLKGDAVDPGLEHTGSDIVGEYRFSMDPSTKSIDVNRFYTK